MIGRNDVCWCGSGKKWKKCHFPHPSPEQKSDFDSGLAKKYLDRYGILLKTPEQIEKIRASCRLASKILDAICAEAKAGVTTAELDTLSRKLHREAGAVPAPLGYGSPPFPASICTSLNEVICHGIPDDTPLKDGDILNIDVTCILNGFYGDNSRMVSIGKISEEKQTVTDVSYECLIRSIAILKPGIPVSAIGEIIEDYALSKNCSVVYQFVAHGVGVNFHEAPQIAHHRNKNETILVPGMTFTIEPMINAGTAEGVIDRENRWVATTKDGRASAQWEHTILITDTGHEILTDWKR